MGMVMVVLVERCVDHHGDYSTLTRGLCRVAVGGGFPFLVPITRLN